MSARAPHYIRPASQTTVPRLHLALDVETRPEAVQGGERQVFRLACGELWKSDARRGAGPTECFDWFTPLDLWAEVLMNVKPGRRLVVWCHNLAFDLRASAALDYLPAFGFECEQIALDHGAAWARFTREQGSLMFADTLTWLPASLGNIAADLGAIQTPKPAGDATDQTWLQRCQADVKVTRQAAQRLLELIEQLDLGPFRPTGAGQSHVAWRRRHLTHRPLVHDDVACLELERRAQWTGRCEAWRWGRLSGEVFSEYDLDLAYCQIAATEPLPSVLAGPTIERDPRVLASRKGPHVHLVRVRVSTEQPVLPAERDGRILWPVGEFETVVWGPELELANAWCARVEVLEAYCYRTAPVLASVAGWITQQLAAAEEDGDGIKRRMLKHWARAHVGRLALRYRSWEDWGFAEEADVSLGLHKDWDTGEVTDMLQLGTKIQVLGAVQEAPDSLPQIPGYIVSECRRRLWFLMMLAGLDHVVYVDTDGLIVDEVGAAGIETAIEAGGFWPIHLKGRHTSLHIHGPRSLIVGTSRRMAGVPLRAGAGGGGKYRGQVFLSLRESLARGDPSAIQILKRTYKPAGQDPRREHLPNGATAPHRIVISTAS